MTAQLERWRQRLAAGDRRIGWKIALNLPAIQAELGISEPVIGHLISSAKLESGGVHSLEGATRAGVEAEIAIRIDRDVPPDADRAAAGEAIGTLAPAIEVVDIDLPFEDLTAILAGNAFHRAVLLGQAAPISLSELGAVRARVLRNGREEASTEHEPGAELVQMVLLVARLLGRFEERLRAGDVIIAGSLTPIVWVEPGDQIEITVDPLGTLEAGFTD